jgi:TolB-like protein
MIKLIGKKNPFVLNSLILILFILSFFFYGCKQKHYTRPENTIEKVNTIAVLPFENLTPHAYANEKVRSAVIIELLARGFDIVEPGEVTSVLYELDVRTLGALSTSDIQYIGETLGVNAVMKGAVGTYQMSRGISVSYPEVSIHLMLLNATSGKITWNIWRTAGGPSFWTRHFGAETSTLDEIVREVIKNAIDTLQ